MLPENPRDARWLDIEEKRWLETRLARERAEREAGEGGRLTLWRAFREPRVLLFALAYFFGLVASNGFGFWLPTMVKSLFGLSTLAVTLLVSLPYSLGFVAKIASGWSSDRTGDRRWHTNRTAAPRVRGSRAVGLIDLYPTLLSLCGLPEPTEQQLDGIDLTPVLKGEPGD